MVALDDRAKEYNQLEKLFELQISKYKEISECKNDLKALKTLWDAISMVNF
jgi:dynein heavy chain